MLGARSRIGDYAIRIWHAADGFVVEVRRDGETIRRCDGVQVEDAGPLAGRIVVEDLAVRLEG